MCQKFVWTVTLLVSLFSNLTPSAQSRGNRYKEDWHVSHENMKTTHQLPDNAIKLSKEQCVKSKYCTTGHSKEALMLNIYDNDGPPHIRRKRVLTHGDESISNLTIYLPPNSKCFKVFESCDCNTKEHDREGIYLEFLNVQNNKIDLTVNDREWLLNFMVYPNTFKLCDESEDAVLKTKHCQTAFRLDLESKGTKKPLKIDSNECTQLNDPKHGLFTKPEDKLYLVHKSNVQKDAFTCFEAFSRNDCNGKTIRIIVPNDYYEKGTASEIVTEIWQYSAKKNTAQYFDIRSVRKCSYCMKDPADDIVEYAIAPPTTSTPEVLPEVAKQQNENSETCPIGKCCSIQSALTGHCLDLTKNCYVYFNNTECYEKLQLPLVKDFHVDMVQLEIFLKTYPHFENWSVAECNNGNEKQTPHCLKPFLGKTRLEDALKNPVPKPKKSFEPSSLELALLYVVGSIAVIMLVVVIIMSFMLWRKKKRIREIRQRCVPHKRGGPYQHSRNLNVHQMDRIDENDYVSDITGLRALCASFADGYEIPRDHINIGNMRDSTASIIGVGEFSIAFKGHLESHGRTVAVKTMKTGQATTRTIKGALRECQIFKQLGKHPGILEFLGVSTENASKGEIFIVMAWCEKGPLRGFLAQQKSHFASLVQDGEWINDENLKTALDSNTFIENGPPVKFNTIQLFKWCLEIADAMEFLAIRKIVHVSLSARNVLLDEKFACKISDFHLAKVPKDSISCSGVNTLSRANLYKQERLVPWRWYAIESLMDDVFSSHSDVWAFGIVMWEVFSLGATPYQEYIYGSEFTLCIKHGYRLQTPNFATVECYQLMLMCWYDAPEKRPTFTKLKSKLAELIPEKNIPISPGPFQIVRSLSKSS